MCLFVCGDHDVCVFVCMGRVRMYMCVCMLVYMWSNHVYVRLFICMGGDGEIVCVLCGSI